MYKWTYFCYVVLSEISETWYTSVRYIPIDTRFEFSPSCIQNVPLISYRMFKCADIPKLNMSFLQQTATARLSPSKLSRTAFSDSKKLLQQSSCMLTVILNFGNCKGGKRNVLSSAPSCHGV